MKEEKNKVQEPEQLNAASGIKDGWENKIHEEIEMLKLKFAAKVNVLTEDKDLREKLHEVIGEAVDESMTLGQTTGVSEDMMKSLNDTFSNALSGLRCLSSVSRAETYKKLFHNQRIITAHLMSASQLLQLQIGETESMVIPTFPCSELMQKANSNGPI